MDIIFYCPLAIFCSFLWIFSKHHSYPKTWRYLFVQTGDIWKFTISLALACAVLDRSQGNKLVFLKATSCNWFFHVVLYHLHCFIFANFTCFPTVHQLQKCTQSIHKIGTTAVVPICLVCQLVNLGCVCG